MATWVNTPGLCLFSVVIARIGGSTHSNQMDQRLVMLSTTVRKTNASHPINPDASRCCFSVSSASMCPTTLPYRGNAAVRCGSLIVSVGVARQTLRGSYVSTASCALREACTAMMPAWGFSAAHPKPRNAGYEGSRATTFARRS